MCYSHDMLSFTGSSDDTLSVSDINGDDELYNPDGRFVILVHKSDGIEQGAVWLEFEYGPRNERGDGVWAVQLYPYSEEVRIPWEMHVTSEGYRTSVCLTGTENAVWRNVSGN